MRSTKAAEFPPNEYDNGRHHDGHETRAGMSDITTRLKLIADWVDVDEFYDDNGELDAHRATREIFRIVGALVTGVVVDDLNAIPLVVDDAEAMILLTQRYRWTAHERIASVDSWRRWPTDRLAALIVNSMAKVLPPFWWKVDAGDALAVAAGIIDGYRDETGLIESDTREFVDSIRFAVIGSVEPGSWAFGPVTHGNVFVMQAPPVVADTRPVVRAPQRSAGRKAR
jgi:hypothetical protein